MLITTDYTADQLTEFRTMIEAQWSAVDAFDSEQKSSKLPPPVLAFVDYEVVGGLSFTWHNKPDSNVIGLWVNTVYVRPSQRHRGVASALLKKAVEMTAQGYAEYGLYAYTDTAALYESNGWHLVNTIDAHSIYQYRKVS